MENKMYNPDHNPPYNPSYGSAYPPPPAGQQAPPGFYPQPGLPPAGPYGGPPPSGPYGGPPPSGPYGGPPPSGPYGGPPPSYASATGVEFRPNTVNPEDRSIDGDSGEGLTPFGSSFSDKNIRRMFVRKVYLILLTQLLFTFSVVALFIFQKDVKGFVRSNPACYYVSYATFLVTYITLICCPAVRRKYPGNVICLVVFTMALSYMTGTISSFYDTDVVFYSAGICAGVCFGVTMLSMWSKFDMTGFGGLLWIASLVLFFFGIIAIFTFNKIMYTVYAGLFALLMMLYLGYHTQLIMGGRRHELSAEEYILASLMLYLDVVYIFLMILGLFGRGK